MQPTIPDEQWAAHWSRLDPALDELAARCPDAATAPRRRPVHVVYGGAHLFRADTARRQQGRQRGCPS